MNSTHIRRYYIRNNETFEDKVPKHYLDSRTFKVFASTPHTVSTHGRFSFQWTSQMQQQYHWSKWAEIATFVSVDGGPFRPISCWRSVYSNSDAAQHLAEEIHHELQNERIKFQKARTNRLAKERRDRAKAKAAELGISFEAARKLVVEENKIARASKATKKDIERTKRIMKVAPLIRDLKNEVDAFLQQLEEDPTKVHITHVDKGSRELRHVISNLESWNKGR